MLRRRRHRARDRRARCGPRSPTPGSAGGSVERALVVRESPSAFLAGVVARRQGAARRRPAPTRRRRSARWSRASALERVAELIDDAVAAGRDAALRRPADARRARRRVLRARGRSPASRPRCALCARGGARPRARRSRRSTPRTRRSRGPTRAALRPRRLGLDRRPLQGRARSPASCSVGMVWMNDHLVDRSAPQLPWGGVAARASAVRAARSRCARAPSRRSSPGTRRAAAPAWWFPYDGARPRGGLPAALGADATGSGPARDGACRDCRRRDRRCERCASWGCCRWAAGQRRAERPTSCSPRPAAERRC